MHQTSGAYAGEGTGGDIRIVFKQKYTLYLLCTKNILCTYQFTIKGMKVYFLRIIKWEFCPQDFQAKKFAQSAQPAILKFKKPEVMA